MPRQNIVISAFPVIWIICCVTFLVRRGAQKDPFDLNLSSSLSTRITLMMHLCYRTSACKSTQQQHLVSMWTPSSNFQILNLEAFHLIPNPITSIWFWKNVGRAKKNKKCEGIWKQLVGHAVRKNKRKTILVAKRTRKKDERVNRNSKRRPSASVEHSLPY